VGDFVYEGFPEGRDRTNSYQPNVSSMLLKPEENITPIDRHDAELFKSLSQFIWVQGEPLLLMYEVGHEIYTSQGIDLQSLKSLQAVGLLSLDPVGYVKKWFGKHTRLFYFGKPTKIQFPQDANNRFDLGHVILTEKGKTLIRVSNAARNQKFYEYTIEIWFRQGLVTSSILPPVRSI
jgi:hypothetical protein